MRRVVWFTFVILSTLALLILLWQFSISLVLFVLSLAVAAAVRPSITSLTQRGYSRRLAMGIVYALTIGFFVMLIIAISQPLFQDMQRIADDFAVGYEQIKLEWPRTNSIFKQALAEQLPPTADLYTAITSDEGVNALRRVFGVAQNFFTIVGRILVIIILSLYWSADQLRFERLALSLLPREYHKKARQVWMSIETGVGAYVRSELIQSVLVGIALGLGYWAMGVRYPAVMALWVAVARMIPWFGAMIAVLPPLLVGVGTSPLVGIIASVYTIIILLLMKIFIEPRLFRNRYNSLLIVLFVIALAEIFGIIGVMLAPPLAVAVQILFEQLHPWSSKMYAQEIVDRAEYLQKRIARLEKRMERNGASSETEDQIEQVKHLSHKIGDYVQEY